MLHKEIIAVCSQSTQNT